MGREGQKAALEVRIIHSCIHNMLPHPFDTMNMNMIVMYITVLCHELPETQWYPTRVVTDCVRYS